MAMECTNCEYVVTWPTPDSPCPSCAVGRLHRRPFSSGPHPETVVVHTAPVPTGKRRIQL